MNTHLRDPIMVRLISSGFLILYYHFFWLFEFPPFPPFQALFAYLIISPVPTCLVHNCETSWRFYYFHSSSSLYCDQFPLISISTISISMNDKNHWCTKYIDVQYYFTKERTKAGEVTFQYILSSENITNILTKPLP